MMRNDIPGEIWINIVIHLSQHDLSTCTRICRSWNITLTPMLYSSVDILSSEQVETFINTLCKTELSNPLGRFVRKLNLPYYWKPDSVVALPRLCPFVTEFDMKRSWYPELAEVLQEWKYLTKVPRVIVPPSFSLHSFGKHIRQLELHINRCPGWVNLMIEFPCVEELHIDGDIHNVGGENAIVSLHDLEELHKALPRLRDIDMYGLSFYGEIPEHLVPSYTVQKFQFCFATGHLWGRYFARKYTNLEYLHIDQIECDESVIQEAKTLVRSCRGLRQFSDFLSNHYPSRLYRECLEILGEISAPLAYLTFHLWDAPAYTTIVSGFHVTVLSICFSTEDGLSTEEIVEPLKTCLALETLNIRCPNTDFGMDYCLKCCKGLKELEIEAATIWITKDSTIGFQHGLETLSVAVGITRDEITPYLSLHCPLLSSLRCPDDVSAWEDGILGDVEKLWAIHA